MLIKITKCSNDNYWYKECIGHIYETIAVDPGDVNFTPGKFLVNVNGGQYFVNREDCDPERNYKCS